MYSIEYPGERRISVLFPKYLKKAFKESVRHLLYWKNRKPYLYYVNAEKVELCPVVRKNDEEFFYGYYDKCPERNGMVLFHVMAKDYVKIVVKSLSDGTETIIGESSAYNWQLGSRAVWISDDVISFNDFDGQRYISKWYSICSQKIIKTVPLPMMDYVKDRYILSPNFQRLRIVDPCYAYKNLPVPSDEELLNYDADGIWLYDLIRDESKLLISISDMLNCKSESVHKGGFHGLNHIMVSPNGNAFIFIHRCRSGCERYDRLMLYDLNNETLSCLMDGKLQSHFCWLDNSNVFGYGEFGNEVGFYKIDTLTKQPQKCYELTNIHPKDGHPTVHGEWIVVDSYPNFSRLQSLIAYNFKTNKIINLGEFYHDMSHAIYTRCDLHPRFNSSGNRIFFDTLYTGKRQLCSLNIKF